MSKSKLFLLTAPVILGLLTPLSFAPYYQFWLMPLLFAALALLLERRPQYAVRSAYLFGLAGYTAQFYWIHTALHDISGLPNLYALPLTLLLPAYLALFPAAATWLWRKGLQIGTNRHLAADPFCRKARCSDSLYALLALPVFWTLAEFARERFLTGFGWGALGYSQIADASPLAGFAPLGGIHLLTFITALFGVLLARLVAAHGKIRLIYAALSAALLLIGFAAKQADFTEADGTRSTVALAQGNIAQSLKFDENQFLPTVQRYFEQVANSRAEIVILPETAIPVLMQDLPPELLDSFAKQAEANGSALALGIARYTDDGHGYLNAVALAGKQMPSESGASAAFPPSENWAFYAKNHLVPFGEYKPLPFLTEPLYRLMNMPLSDFHRGGHAQAPLPMGKQQVAFNICYEDGFGDELIASARQSSLLANASNMAWYGTSNAMYQQLQQSQARALELGRYMVRATNTGFTAIVDNKGRVTAQLLPDTAAVLNGEIEGFRGETPYMKLGSSYPLMILLAIIGAALLIARRKAV
ncbi:MAG: apolipoprotein N-acyltransferase [Neisseria sp.]|nr:apolipoprotein N-acyltransferase [Neisseria sp.]